MRRVVGLKGLARSGKDVSANGLIELGYVKRKFADPVYQALIELNPSLDLSVVTARVYDTHVPLQECLKRFSMESLKNLLPELRCLIQRVGTEAGRHIHGNNCWVDIFKNRVRRLDPDINVVATDVRFLNEYKAIFEMGGITIFITGNRGGLQGSCGRHVSEDIESVPHNAIVVNNGSLQQLQDTVVSVVDRWFEDPSAFNERPTFFAAS